MTTAQGWDESKVVRNGGKFAAFLHDDNGEIADLDTSATPYDVALRQESLPLAQREQKYGKRPNVHEGSRTPWGPAQSATEDAPGIVFASTGGHGGFKLSPERNAGIPTDLRNKNGWYEEDCESNIVAMYYPEAFPHVGGSAQELSDGAERSVKDYFPDQYTKATGIELTEADSSTLRDRAKAANEQAYREEHKDEFVSTGWGSDYDGSWVPEGYYAIEARREADGEKRQFLIPKEECISDHMLRRAVLVDPRRHRDVTGIGNIGMEQYKEPEVPLVKGDDLKISTDHLTPAAQKKAEKELDTHYRYPDGSIKTLREDIEESGLRGKSYVLNDAGTGKKYYLKLEDGSHVRPVSKAVWDSVQGAPDVTKESHKANMEMHMALSRASKYEANFEGAKARKARAEAEEWRKRHDEAQAEERKDWKSPEELQEMRRAAMVERFGEDL